MGNDPQQRKSACLNSLPLRMQVLPSHPFGSDTISPCRTTNIQDCWPSGLGCNAPTNIHSNRQLKLISDILASALPKLHHLPCVKLVLL